MKFSILNSKEKAHLAIRGGYVRYEAILVFTLADIYRMEKEYTSAEVLLNEAMKPIKKVGIKGGTGSQEPVSYWTQQAKSLNYQAQEKQSEQTSLGMTEIIALPFL